jgi:hypothetical protein
MNPAVSVDHPSFNHNIPDKRVNDSFNDDLNYSRSNGRNGFSKRNHKGKKIFKILLLFIILVIPVFLLRAQILNLLLSKTNKVSKPAVQGEKTQVTSQIITLGKKFSFPGLDDTGKKKGKIDFKITTVEKTNQVIVQDKTYTAKNDKTFLIVNLELKNDTTNRLNIFPGDMIRLVVDGQEEKKFAPDLHNNYVLVAPISTKIERVGFVIDAAATNLKLQVGELEGDKEMLPVKF